MDIAAGFTFGPYRIEEQIGVGGMGVVYRATDTHLEREVALKLISDIYLATDIPSGTPSRSPGGTQNSTLLLSHERFLREARAAATLNHPNICAIYATGEQDGRPYLVMELLRGETLRQYLRRNGKVAPLSVAETLAFAQQAASGVTAAHAAGIIHRDIKPANIFIVDGPRGRKQIKLLDFGLAKRQGLKASPDSHTHGFPLTKTTLEAATQGLDLTSPGSAIGTAAYMSPEQAKGQPLDARSDLFSLGVVIYEMATGEVPFPGGTAAEVFAALLTKNPRPLSSVNPEMPVGFDSIVERLLEKDKQERYQSADELESALDFFQETQREANTAAAGKVPASSSSAVVPAPARGKFSHGMVAILAIALVVVVGFALLLRHRSPSPAASGVTAAAPVRKDAIILADFVNKTGDPVFDTTLNQALRVQLGQSPVLDIVSPQHLKQSMQFLGRKPDEPLTPALAREIGEREGMKAILTGTIAPVGNAYLITLNAQNTVTGDDIATTQTTAADKDRVLGALNDVATGMRAKLGESLASIKKLNTPFGQATTPLLEAFRAYALGDQAHARGSDIPEAESHYKRALELDPNLAMAWARLGVLYSNSGQTAKAHEYFTKAYGLTQNVSEREKLYIDGHYYSEVQGDLDKAIETLQVATQEYPLQTDNFINLSVAYALDGQPENAYEYIHKADAIQLNDSTSIEDSILDATQLDQFAEAEKYVTDAERLKLKGVGLLVDSARVFAVQGDWTKANAAVSLISTREDGFIAALLLSPMFSEAGQIQKAHDIARQGIASATAAGAKDAQAELVMMNAATGWETGVCQNINDAVSQALQLDHDRDTQITAVGVLMQCGHARDALKPLEELLQKHPQDTLLHGYFAPLTRAAAALEDGDGEKALELAEQARRFDAFSFGPYIRGLANMKLGRPAAAAEEFETASRLKGLTIGGEIGSMPWAVIKLRAGRAYAAAGDKAEAKKNYQLFFKEWKNADPELQIMADARKEYAAL